MLYSFEDFSLDTARRELRRSGALIELQPQVFDLLEYLIRSRERVVSKDDLLATVWHGRIVSESTLGTRINAARSAIGDNGGEQRLLRTAYGKGIRFVGAVREEEEMAGPPLPDKPSIAVLPFTNMSGDPEQEYFADGMVEEIITALSRIRWLFVIARNSSFTYKRQSVDARQVGRELGVRYLLEGSVRKAGGRVRITAQLIEAETGAHLWADRFDGRLEDVFELQDQVAISAAGVVEPTLQAAEIRRSGQRPTKDLTAHDLYLRALPYWASYEKDGIAQASEYLGQAIERDRQYGPALALMAQCHFQLDKNGWADDREINQRRGIDLARQALRSAPDDPEVLANAAIALGYFGEDIDAAIGLVDRSLTLNPSFAQGWFWSGVLRKWFGRPDLALDHFETFLRLSPRERFLFHEPAMGMSMFFLHRFDEAVARFITAMQQHPKAVIGHRFLAACYAHMGRLDEAREVVARLRTLTSVVLDSGVRYRNPDHRELYLSGLRLAIGETSQA